MVTVVRCDAANSIKIDRSRVRQRDMQMKAGHRQNLWFGDGSTFSSHQHKKIFLVWKNVLQLFYFALDFVWFLPSAFQRNTLFPTFSTYVSLNINKKLLSFGDNSTFHRSFMTLKPPDYYRYFVFYHNNLVYPDASPECLTTMLGRQTISFFR